MDFDACSQCGKEIDGKGVQFRDRVFCSDECCDEFEEELLAKDALSIEDLDDIDENELMSRSHDDLGYRGDNDLEEFDEDDFDIDPDDF